MACLEARRYPHIQANQPPWTRSAMTNCLNGVTHGPVHVLIGGAWGEGTTFDDGEINFVRNINKVLYFKVRPTHRIYQPS